MIVLNAVIFTAKSEKLWLVLVFIVQLNRFERSENPTGTLHLSHSHGDRWDATDMWRIMGK